MRYPHGLFTWTDISLPDPEAGKAFYTRLFGWEAEDQRDPEGGYIYTMFRQDGADVAGMGQLPADMAGAGIPPAWSSYISVDDVETAVEAFVGGGGAVVMPAMDVMTSGRMAIVADPEGAVVSLWQAGDHPGAGAFDAPGQLTWNELATRDAEAAKSFYGQALGWRFSAFEGGDQDGPPYWLIEVDKAGAPNAADDPYNGGILTMNENFPPDLPAHWMVYFCVADTDAAATRVQELGGSIPVPAFDTPAGRIAVVNDPQGGWFSIISAPPAD